MKIALMLLAVLAAIWLFKSNRRASQNEARMQRQQDKAALEMVRCAHCDLHLPGADAVMGRQGLYCSDAHRQVAER